MSLLSFKVSTWTPVATADAANLVDNSHQALQGGSATQQIKISEIYEGGQASVTSPMIMLLSRDSQVGTGALTLATGATINVALDPATAALAAPPAGFTLAATNKPQRSATLGLLNLSFNAWGGVVVWKSAQGEELIILGNTASFGEVSLSAYTGGTMGLMGSHFIYEPR